MTPLVVENEPPVTFLRRKMTGGRFSMGVVIRRYTGMTLTVFFWQFVCSVVFMYKTPGTSCLIRRVMVHLEDTFPFYWAPHIFLGFALCAPAIDHDGTKVIQINSLYSTNIAHNTVPVWYVITNNEVGEVRLVHKKISQQLLPHELRA